MSKNSLQILDRRTDREYEIEIEEGTIRALELRQIKESDGDFGLMTYDPGYSNTAWCRSKITEVVGGAGILRYRGYPIQELAGRFDFLATAYLIFFGELPDKDEAEEFSGTIAGQGPVDESVFRLIETFHNDADPMGMLASATAALGTCHPESGDVSDAANRRVQINRLVAQVPAIAAYIHRDREGLAAVSSDPGLSYAANFLNMTFGAADGRPEVHPALEKALDVLFVLHADHEQNCSTATMRQVGSSRANPYLAVSAAVGALSGPLHGGANAAVLRMLREIGSVDRIAQYVDRARQGELRLMGFGHRVYKNYDPRARIIKKVAEEVFEVTGSNPLLDVALELERIALREEYFIKRKLYPNVDFYSGLIYQAMGFPTEMFTVLFAVARTVGWMAQWDESVADPEQRIARPRQIYLGPDKRLP